MKKRFLVIVIIAILVLSACSKGDITPQKLSYENFVSYVSFSENENHFSGLLCCSSDGEVKLTVIEPKNIKGIIFSATKSGSIISYDNISISCENNKILLDSQKAINNLFEVIYACFSNEPKQVTSAQYKLPYPFGEAIITLNDAQISSIRAGEYDYQFTGMSESA